MVFTKRKRKKLKYSPIQVRYCVFFIVSQVPVLSPPPPGPLTELKSAYVSEMHGKETTVGAVISFVYV